MIAQIRGKVIKGKRRGKKLGYPTANVAIPPDVPEGIYISLTLINNKEYPSLTFIGNAKTFHETDYVSETYILNFNRDIYGKTIAVQLLEKLRDNQKFDTPTQLISKMSEDKKAALEYFNKT